MRTFSGGRLTRVIAQALTLTFLWSVALLNVPLLPAKAQISMRTAATQSVAVLPFDNRSQFALGTLGEEASQAVSVELRERLLLDVLPSSEVAMVMRDLGSVPPLNDPELIRLCSELEVTMVVTGEVRRAEVTQTRSGRRGEVTLAVRLFDRVAEDAVNGALVEAYSPYLADADDATLVRKALEQAAFETIREMRTRPSVTATVLWNRDDVVYLSAGSRAGLQEGMQMAVIRGGQRIGLVEITSAERVGSYGRLVSGPQLQSGTQLRAIYRLPTRVGVPPPGKVARKKKGLETMLIGAAGLLGLANLGSAARLLGEGNIAAPGFVASDLADELELIWLPAAVLLTWGQYDEPTERSRLIGYEIWSDQVGLVEVISTQLDPRYFIDWFIGYPTTYRTASFTIDSVTGALAVASAYPTTTDPDSVVTEIVWGEGSTTIDYTWWPFGPVWGMPNQYSIKPVLAVQDIDGVWTLTRATEMSTTPNRVVPLLPPMTSGVYIHGMTATFDFYTPMGATDAIIQIARDPYDDFQVGRVYSNTISGTWTDMDPYTLAHIDVDLNQVLALPGSGDYYWYRFGSRNRHDTTYPRPFSVTDPDPNNDANDMNWVWSDVQRITLWSAAGREAAVHREREALARSKLSRTRLLSRHRGDREVHTQ
jgi:hypothetical protein